MKHIEILDNAAKNKIRFKDININPTFAAAYFYRALKPKTNLSILLKLSGITTSTQSLKTVSTLELANLQSAQHS